MILKPEDIFSAYLEKHGCFFGNRIRVPWFSPEIIVVIPCFDEENIREALQSLWVAYRYSPLPVLIIVVINASSESSVNVLKNNAATAREIEDFRRDIPSNETFCVEIIHDDKLPPKDAGVGLARKMGMDEAVRIFKQKGVDGIITCFDADSLCRQNYFSALQAEFQQAKSWDAASIHFEHPLEGYSDEIIRSIIDYELHLRVFIGFQKWAALPYAMQTIGSSMAVRASSYCKFGGMNKRKAGEDFYFLHKIGDNGVVGSIRSTMVIPSPRISHRVPFGTGKAVGENVRNDKKIMTYHPKVFTALRTFLQKLPEIYTSGFYQVTKGSDGFVTSFFIQHNADEAIRECKQHTRDYQGFKKRFYQWFNAFRLMKYCHFCRDVSGIPDVEPLQAFLSFMELTGQGKPFNPEMNAKDALCIMRNSDRQNDL